MTPIDLFLSYHRSDREAVETVQQALNARGLTTFVDYTNLIAGVPWPQALEQALDNVRAVAVFVGREIGSWQKREMYFAINRQANEEAAGRSFPVIPVLITGADLTSGFLSLNTWVDLRQSLTSEEAIGQLLRAIRGETQPKPDEDVVQLSPYRELKAFGEEHAAFFFGREELSLRLLERIRSEKGLVAVIGPSGSGKSSVVHAGLVPLLRRERPPAKTWDAVSFTPGDRPFHRLAAVLIPLLEQGMTETQRLAEQVKLGDCLADGSVRLADVAQRISKKSTDRLLIIVDQFEELITLTPKADLNGASAPGNSRTPLAVAFVNCMMDAMRADAPLQFAITLRADFYGQVIGLSRELSDRLEQCVVNVGPMSESELQRAIEEPAKKVGLSFETELVHRLLRDFGGEPGQLPLLEFALWELWRQRESHVMTHVAYERFGGVTKAIDNFAHAELLKFDEPERASIRRIFTRLVRLTSPGERGVDSRQRISLSELDSSSRQLVVRLSDARLLVTSRDEFTGQENVEVSHEALIREWSDLRSWLNEDREFLLWRQRLGLYLSDWQRATREEGSLLRGAALSEAARWQASRRADLNEDENDFIGLSIERRQKSLLEEQQRRRNRMMSLVFGLLVVSALAVVAAVLWVREANQRRIAVARTLLAPAIVMTNADRSKLDQAALLAIESLNFDDTDEAKGILREAITLLPKEIVRFQFDCDGKASLSPGGLFLVCLDKSRRDVRVISVSDPKREVHPPLPQTSEIFTVAASPTGQYLGVGFRDHGIQLIETQSGSLLVPKIEANDGLVTFSQDGKYFATAVTNRETTAIYLVPLSHGAGTVQTFRVDRPILGLTFSADSKFLAASHEGHPDVEVAIFDLTTGMRTNVAGGAALPALALSAGATIIAIPYLDNTVRAKNAQSGTEYGKITHQQLATAVAVTSDGKYVASGSEDGTARAMQTESGRPIAIVPAGSPVVSVAFTADNKLVLVSADNTVRTVNILNRPAFQVLPMPGIFGLSPRGGYFSVFDNEKSELTIVDRVTGKTRLSVPAPPDLVTTDAVRYSSDDQYLAMPDPGKSTTVYELGNPTPHHKNAPGIIEQTISGGGKGIAWSTAHTIQLSPIGDGPDDRFQGMLEFPNAYVLQLSPDGTLLVAAGKDPVAGVFDVTTKKKLYEVQSRSRITNAIFSPDGRLLLISTDKKVLILCAARTGSEVWPRMENADTTMLAFSDDGKLLAAAGGGERGAGFEVTVTDTASQRILLRVPEEALPTGIAFGHDGNFLDIFDNTSFTRYYMVTKDLVEQTCSLVTRNLRQNEWISFVGNNAYHRTCPNLP